NANQLPPGAQSSPNTSLSQDQSAQPQAQGIPQELRDQLTGYGFSDVKVMPESFIVTAKKDGRQVVMWLTPHSARVLAAEPLENETTGSGANSPNPKDPTSSEQNLQR